MPTVVMQESAYLCPITF